MARLYNSCLGAFCSADPVEGQPGDPQSWNRYAYVRNDPIDLTDPTGRFWGFIFAFLGWIFHGLGAMGGALGQGNTRPRLIESGKANGTNCRTRNWC